MPATARLAITVQCPECCYDVKPFVLMFNANAEKPHVHVQCPRDECQRIFDVYRDEYED